MFKKMDTLKLFFESPTREFNIREVARILKISPTTASRELKNLNKEKLLIEKKERMLKLYKANIDEQDYKDFKTFYNIQKLRKSGFIDALNEFYLKPTIVLFGSASLGMDTETSDFDILIISELSKDFPELEKFEKKLNRRVQLFPVKKIKDLKNQHLIENVLNGIVLQGKIKWTWMNASKKDL